jgi:energy-coupling factor transport system substrate-specific component
VTWQLSSTLVLAVTLAAGFAWYERTHPPAKVLALVATLAALAVLGRIAFAPLPNVKPTMALILIAGYVLGAAPGFAVGAVCALASNVFFGQGPFTPWQMVGFGALGLFGALLARVAGPGLGRAGLATAGAVGGFALGLFLDFGDWVLYTEHTLAGLAVVAGRGLPFDVALAAGNVVFCLAFGPALVRALRRFRERFEITWQPVLAAGLVALVVLPVATAHADTASRAADYLERAQVADGGFAPAAGAAGEANAMHSGWAAMALAAAGRNLGCTEAGRASLAYLSAEGERVRDLGDVQRTLLALRAQGRPADALVRRLTAARRRDGSFDRLVNATSFAVLALRAAGRTPEPSTVRWLAGQRNRDGGFNFGGRGGPSGIDDTAAAVQALVAAGRRPSARTLRWLVRRQNADGGFPLSPGAPSNAQSTAFAVQALIAAGRDPDRVRRGGARSPVSYLRTLQAGDGSIRYSRTSRQTPTWVTAQALLALEGAVLPVRSVRACPRAAGATTAPAPSPATEPTAPTRTRAREEGVRRGEAASRPARRSRNRRTAATLDASARRAGALAALLLVPLTR